MKGGTGERINERARSRQFVLPFTITCNWKLPVEEDMKNGREAPRGVHCLISGHVPSSGEHFLAYLPLQEIIEDPVPSITRAEKATSNVNVFPLAILLDQILRSWRTLKSI